MKLRVRTRLALSFLALSLGVSAPAADVKEMQASAQTVDQALAGKQVYNFAIVSDREVIDFEGRHFPPADVAGYLARAKPDKNAAYMFWIPNPEAKAIAQAIVPKFADYGAHFFVVREMDDSGKSASIEPPAPAAGKATRKVAMIVGRPNPKARTSRDPLPDLSGRPPGLRPGALPPRVRYVFQPDAVVQAAADETCRVLCGTDPIDPKTLHTSLLIEPGAWKRLAHLAPLKSTKTMIAKVELSTGVTELEGHFIDKPEDCALALAEVRRLLAEDNGAGLRALRSEEMNFWWTFIGFDIEEPVFVVESKACRYRFIVTTTDGRISLIDELKALPRP